MNFLRNCVDRIDFNSEMMKINCVKLPCCLRPDGLNLNDVQWEIPIRHINVH